MSITYELNEELNGIEIKFSEKPTAKVLAKMKALGFRWNNKKFVWYAKQTDERLEFAKSIIDEDNYEQITLFPIKDEPKAEPKPEPKKEPKKATEKPKAKTSTPSKSKAVEKPQKTDNKATKKPEKDNVVEFLKSAPNFNLRLTFDENATIEECVEKINKEKEVFKDSSSGFVLDGILEMCKANPNFRNNFMQESKTFKGAFLYFMEMARKGFAHNINGVACMDANLALSFALDYYNLIEE